MKLAMFGCLASQLQRTKLTAYRAAWFTLLLVLQLVSTPLQAQGPTAQAKPPAAPSNSNAGLHSTTNGNGRPALRSRDERYRLRPTDVITVSFMLTDMFNQTVSVQPDGFISLRVVGDLRVANLTLPEVTKLIRTAYASIVSPQEIVVELKDFEKPYFIVNGEVGSPGRFDMRGDTTVTQAIAIAGGFRDSAKHSQVLLFRRVSEEWTEAKKLDIKRMLQAGNLAEDPHLRSGDMLFVPKNMISKIKPFIPTSSLGLYTRSF